MFFCKNCGNKLEDIDKFCSQCGKAVIDTIKTDDNRERKISYEGKIHKCPSCGEVLKSFEVNCTACGYEFRDSNLSETVKDFTQKLLAAENDEQKAAIVRNFPIPNTKEDVFEFIVLASTNMLNEKKDELFNAWFVKFEQSYQKAKLSFEKDSDFTKIQIIYDDTSKQIVKQRTANNANKISAVVSKFTATFPNPIFGIVFVLLMIFEIKRIFYNEFAGLDIIFCALILSVTYKITNKNK